MPTCVKVVRGGEPVRGIPWNLWHMQCMDHIADTESGHPRILHEKGEWTVQKDWAITMTGSEDIAAETQKSQSEGWTGIWNCDEPGWNKFEVHAGDVLKMWYEFR